MNRASTTPSPAPETSVDSRSLELDDPRTRAAKRQKERMRVAKVRPPIGIWTTLKAIPTSAWICALIALLNGVAWSIVTPPFQGRDEPDHFAYVQQLAETGSLPQPVSEDSGYSPEETAVLAALRQNEIRFRPEVRSLSSEAEQRRLAVAVHEGDSPIGSGAAGLATSEPPLYYALETVPYVLGRGNVLTQLELMRLVSAMLAALTILLIFFFLREVVPDPLWVASVATLCLSLQPLFGFMTGTLNPDSMLYAVSAALFLCLARAFRRGLTRRLAIATGLVIAVGFATKLNFVGLSLGGLLGLVVVGIREVRRAGSQANVALAYGVGIGCAPVAFYAVANLTAGRPILGAASSGITAFLNGSIVNGISYIWDLYLPRLPGMTHYFHGVSTSRAWFDRFVGLYGWGDTMFPSWVRGVALAPAAAVAFLTARALLLRREAIRVRLLEVSIYGVMVLGVLVMVGMASYASDAIAGQEAFADPRYALPLFALFGAVLAFAIIGAGPRWRPATAVVIVALFIAHDIFSQLQVIARYYG